MDIGEGVESLLEEALIGVSRVVGDGNESG